MANTTDRFKFFLPDARVLTAEEVSSLPSDKRTATGGKEGVWIEMRCPTGSCRDAAGVVTIPAEETGAGGEKGTWLKLFCPEGQCEYTESTSVP